MIDVAMRPGDVRDADLAIVIDVLRATTTATQALATGYRRVLCADSLDRALTLRGSGRVLAGERDCVKPPGFDQGNSPLEALSRHGDELVLATTNGTPAIAAAASHAPTVIVGCLLNLDAVVRTVLEHNPEGDFDVQLVCSGTKGAVALEDVYVAGRISHRLPGARTDATRVAEALTRAFPTALEALSGSSDAHALETVGMGEDISFCAQESIVEVVPAAATVTDGVPILETVGA